MNNGSGSYYVLDVMNILFNEMSYSCHRLQAMHSGLSNNIDLQGNILVIRKILKRKYLKDHPAVRGLS